MEQCRRDMGILSDLLLRVHMPEDNIGLKRTGVCSQWPVIAGHGVL